MADLLTTLKLENFAIRNTTATNKYYTFLDNEDILIGPFKENILNKIIERSKLMKKWGTKIVQHPTAVESEKWLVFDNFTSDYQLDKSKSKVNESKKFWITYIDQIANQNEVCDSEKWIYGLDETESYNPVHLLEAYIHLWLLNVGNNSFTDTFVDLDKKKLYIIDYDSDRTAKSVNDEVYFYFPRSPNIKCKFFEYMGRYYEEVSDLLNNVIDISPEYKARVEYAQNLLKNHYNDWTNRYGNSAPIASTSGLFPTKYPDIDILGNIKSEPEENIASSSGSVSKGKMTSRQGGGTTFLGYQISDMKTYLRQFIQEGNVEKARIVGAELYRIRELTDSSAKGNFTSFINLLKIITIEDIGIADPDLTVSVIDFLNRNPEPPFGYIDGIILDLSEAPKTHLSLNVLKTYTGPKCIQYAKNKWNLQIDVNFSPEDDAFIDKYINIDIFDKKDPEVLREKALVFYSRLLEKNYNAVTWWNFFNLDAKNNNTSITARKTYYDGQSWKRVGQKEPTIILWDIISRIFNDNGDSPINSLRWAYFNDVKKGYSVHYAIFSILAYINNITLKFVRVEPTEDYQKYLNGDYEFSLPKNTRGRTNIVNLNPESVTYNIESFKDISRYC